MNTLNESDIALLFGKLVIFSDEGKNALETQEEKTKLEGIKDPISDDPSAETALSEKDHSKPEAAKKTAEYLVICEDNIKTLLLAPDSNWKKIIQSLGLSHLENQLKSLSEIDMAESGKLARNIWTLGLDEETGEILKGKTDKILLSQNPDQEWSKEEKIKLFIPIKEFAGNLK